MKEIRKHLGYFLLLAAILMMGIPAMVFAEDIKPVQEEVPIAENTAADQGTQQKQHTTERVYLNGRSGNDSNTGADSQNPVLTLAKALELVVENGTIIIDDQVDVGEDMVVENVTIERGKNYNNRLISLESSAHMTLKNTTIDGKKEEHPNQNGNYTNLIYVHTGELQLEEGTVLKDNNASAIYVDNDSKLIMNGGTITGNFDPLQGGGISIRDAEVTLNGGSITENRTDGCGGGVLFLGNGTLTLEGTEISGNHSIAGGGIHLEAWSGEIIFNMSGGAIKENVLEPNTDGYGYYWMADGAGIRSYGPNVTLNVSGGMIADNAVTCSDPSLDAGEGVGSAISLNGSNGEVSTLYLGGSPDISGDVWTWDESEAGGESIVVRAGFRPIRSIAVEENYREAGRNVIRIPAGVTAEEAESWFTPVDEQVYLQMAGEHLQWKDLTRVTFKDETNLDTYKTCYLRPGTLIDPSLAPVEGTGEKDVKAPIGYFLDGWKRWAQENNGPEWDFAKDRVGDSRMTLQPIWGLKQPSVTVSKDREEAQLGETTMLTAAASHEAAGTITYTYQWYQDGEAVKGATKPQLAVKESGSYVVKVTASDGTLVSAEAASQAVMCSFSRPTIWYALHFETNGGSKISSLVEESGATIDLAEYIPIRDGYTFGGWYVDEALTELITEVKLSSTKTIYAGWEKDGPVIETKKDQAIYMTVAAQERDLKNGSRNTMSKVCTLKLGFAVDDPDLSLSYTTSDPKVAVVEDGKITYQGVGSCVITVTAKETTLCKAASRKIEVVVGKLGTPTFTPTVTANTAEKAFVATSSTVRGVDGWEVQYSIRSDWWRATTKDFSGTGTKLYRKTCNTVHSDMTYYIHVRGYQIIDGEKVYSDWSPMKTVQTK